MNICAIAAEYNPFHSGHEYHIEQTRQKLGEDTLIIAVMSGNFVQRGDFAIADKYKRALCAVLGGADLVLELPVPFCLCSAEGFAQGMVYIADSIGGVTHMSFGCEADDPDALKSIADAFCDERAHRLISAQVKQGRSYAAARREAAQQLLGDRASALDLPNNTLAVEYLKALKKFGSDISPVFIKRVGSGHDTASVRGGFFKQRRASQGTACASEIRQMIKNGRFAAAKGFMPRAAAEVILGEIRAGRAPTCAENAERALLARLRAMREMDIASLPDAGGGLSFRILRAIREGTDFYQIAALAKTKVYPEARIRRILMRAYLGIERQMTEQPPLYTSVLACNMRGREFLRATEKNGGFPIIVRPAESKKYAVPIREAFEFGVRADDLFALAQPRIEKTRGGSGFRKRVELG